MTRRIGGFRSVYALDTVPSGYTVVESYFTRVTPRKRHGYAGVPDGVVGLHTVPVSLPVWPTNPQADCTERQALQRSALGLGFQGTILAAGNPDRWVTDELAAIRQLDPTPILIVDGEEMPCFVRAPSPTCSVTRAVDLILAWQAQCRTNPGEPLVEIRVALNAAAAWALGDPVWLILADPEIDDATRTKYQSAIGLIDLNGVDGPFKGGYVGLRRPLSVEVDQGISRRDARLILRALPEAMVLMERQRPAEWDTDAAFVRAVDAEEDQPSVLTPPDRVPGWVKGWVKEGTP